MGERRISKHIQRDFWSALKYALRMAQKLEYKEYKQGLHKDNGWSAELAKFKDPSGGVAYLSVGSVLRMRGRQFE